jgi:hypothetical protein
MQHRLSAPEFTGTLRDYNEAGLGYDDLTEEQQDELDRGVLDFAADAETSTRAASRLRFRERRRRPTGIALRSAAKGGIPRITLRPRSSCGGRRRPGRSTSASRSAGGGDPGGGGDPPDGEHEHLSGTLAVALLAGRTRHLSAVMTRIGAVVR